MRTIFQYIELRSSAEIAAHANDLRLAEKKNAQTRPGDRIAKLVIFVVAAERLC